MSCEKQTYDTYQEAIKALKNICARDKQSMKVYRCTDCRLYHLATNGKNRIGRKQRDEKYHLAPEKAVDIHSTKAAKPVVNPGNKKQWMDKQQNIETTYRPFEQFFGNFFKTNT